MLNRSSGLNRSLGTALALAMAGPLTGLAGLGAGPAAAQEATVDEIRLRQLEASVRALQAQVFSGGGKGLTAAAAPTASTDMLTRMDALEAQVARLTAQNEELANRLRQAGGQSPATAAPKTAAADTPPAPTPLMPEKSATATNLAGMTGGATDAATAKPAPAKPAVKPSPKRLAAVKAVIKPHTADPGDDEYSYGYRLWQAKFYPEAEQQLKLFLDKYPGHVQAGYARNLLGRAFLDDGQPREAAPWFLQNYQADKHGPRAADSLLGLASAMAAIKDTSRACIALGEFASTYPAEARGRLKASYEATRGSVTCA